MIIGGGGVKKCCSCCCPPLLTLLFIKIMENIREKLSGKNIDIEPDISSFQYSYSDQQGRNASITGNVTNAGEIKDIALKEPAQPFPYWIIALLLMPLLGIYLYALLLLEKAIGMFNSGLQREAYVEASNAVRSYFKGSSGIQELTSDEIIRKIRVSKDEGYVGDVRECFMLCDLVKFAKYEPNQKDFNRVAELARRIIV